MLFILFLSSRAHAPGVDDSQVQVTHVTFKVCNAALLSLGPQLQESHAHEISSLCIISSETYTYLNTMNKKAEDEVTFCGEEAPRILLREVLLILQSRWHFLHSACPQLTLRLDLPKWCGCPVSMPKVCMYLHIKITGLSFPSQWWIQSLISSLRETAIQWIRLMYHRTYIRDCSASLSIQNKIEHRSLPINCQLRSPLGICSKVLTQIEINGNHVHSSRCSLNCITHQGDHTLP